MSEDISEVKFFNSSDDLLPRLGSIVLSISVVVLIELGEDAHVPVSNCEHVLLGVEDSLVKDLLEEGGIFSVTLWTRRTIDSF